MASNRVSYVGPYSDPSVCIESVDELEIALNDVDNLLIDERVYRAGQVLIQVREYRKKKEKIGQYYSFATLPKTKLNIFF